MARASAWVAYPDGIEKVEIVRRGAAESRLVRKVKNPVTVQDEDGDVFVVELDSLYNDPVSATVASVELAQRLGVPPVAENPVEQGGDGDDEPDSDPDNELDPDSDADWEDEEDDGDD